MPKLKISCDTGTQVPFELLKDLQGDLKTLSASNYARLRGQIEVHGYSFSAHVWIDSDGTHWLLDGHQRLRVMRSMAQDGWEIPPLPVTVVQADDMKHAESKLLAAVSQYGQTTDETLYEFLNQRSIDIDDIIAANRIPDLDIYAFKASYFDEPKPKADPVEEDHDEKCPTCGKKMRPPKKR